jgi:hypothetical protein
MSIGQAARSRKDIELATAVRKLVHSQYTLDGHIIFGFIDGEFPGITNRLVSGAVATVVTTRLTWMGENRVPYEAG